VAPNRDFYYGLRSHFGIVMLTVYCVLDLLLVAIHTSSSRQYGDKLLVGVSPQPELPSDRGATIKPSEPAYNSD